MNHKTPQNEAGVKQYLTTAGDGANWLPWEDELDKPNFNPVEFDGIKRRLEGKHS